MQRHVIQQQVLDAEFTGGEAQGYGVQDELRSVCTGRLSLALERAFDRLVPEDEHWTIDRLEVDAGAVRREGLEEALVAAVLEAVERQLAGIRRGTAAGTVTMERGGAAGTPEGITTRNEAGYVREALLHFLRTGLLPWWFVLAPGQTLEAMVREQWEREGVTAYADELRTALRNETVTRRLVRQFSPGFRELVLEALAPGAPEPVREALAAARRGEGTEAAQSGEQAARRTWELALQWAARGTEVTLERLRAEGAAAGEAGASSRMETPEPTTGKAGASRRRGEPAVRVAWEEGVLAPCAGIVLLHPFLPRFFEGLGVAEGNRLLDPERAVGLLHYLATGLTNAPEHDLTVAKALCGWPAEDPVEARVEIGEREAAEAEALLTAVVRHWQALGETSVDGLRGAFLVRAGKWTRRADGDWLQMEAQSYDILLDQLPWGIGLIQLPWMERTLWVEWRF